MAVKHGSNKRDFLEGTGDNDVIYGYAGGDIISAADFSPPFDITDIKPHRRFDIEEFNFKTADSTDKDIIYGGDGRDYITGIEVRIEDGDIPRLADQSVIDGGNGKDTLVVSAVSWGFYNRFEAQEIYDSVNTTSIERIVITDYSDLRYVTVNGTRGKDIVMMQSEATVYGRKGNDFLQSAARHADGQELYGGLGRDVLFGEFGDNTLSGGRGKDTFVLSSHLGSKSVITDYEAGERIFIDLAEVNNWNVSLNFKFNKAKPHSKIFADKITYDETTGDIIYVDGLFGDQLLGTIQGAPALADVEFFVV